MTTGPLPKCSPMLGASAGSVGGSASARAGWFVSVIGYRNRTGQVA